MTGQTLDEIRDYCKNRCIHAAECKGKYLKLAKRNRGFCGVITTHKGQHYCTYYEHPHITETTANESDERRPIKCGACGHVGIIVGDCATECEDCGASVDMDTGKPYRLDDGSIVKCGSFGGRHIP